MKRFKTVIAAFLLAAFVSAPFVGVAAETTKAKTKPYTLKTCLVSDEKLGGMGDSYVFTHEGQEIKLCCKACLKDFNKDKTKYMKKLAAAEAKAKKAEKKS